MATSVAEIHAQAFAAAVAVRRWPSCTASGSKPLAMATIVAAGNPVAVVSAKHTSEALAFRAAIARASDLGDGGEGVRFRGSMRHHRGVLTHCMALRVVILAVFVAAPEAQGGIIHTIAGTGICGYNGDGISATSAELYFPQYIAFDASDDLVIAETTNHRIRRVSGGIITTIVGTGTCGYNGDDIAATSAEVCDPTGVAFDLSGALVFADNGNSRIRRVSSGLITTIAGGVTGVYENDPTPATSAVILNAMGVTFDLSGSVVFADGADSERVRRVSGGIVTTMAGSSTLVSGCCNYFGYNGDNIPATSAELSGPCAVAFDSNGNLVFSDETNYRVRRVSGGIIATIAGVGVAGYSGDGGAATSALVGCVTDVKFDPNGNMVIADMCNACIRRVSGGIITTIAGTGVQGYNGDGIAATSAELIEPYSIAFDSNGNLAIAEQNGCRVRFVVVPSASAAETQSTSPTTTSSASSTSSVSSSRSSSFTPSTSGTPRAPSETPSATRSSSPTRTPSPTPSTSRTPSVTPSPTATTAPCLAGTFCIADAHASITCAYPATERCTSLDAVTNQTVCGDAYDGTACLQCAPSAYLLPNGACVACPAVSAAASVSASVAVIVVLLFVIVALAITIGQCGGCIRPGIRKSEAVEGMLAYTAHLWQLGTRVVAFASAFATHSASALSLVAHTVGFTVLADVGIQACGGAHAPLATPTWTAISTFGMTAASIVLGISRHALAAQAARAPTFTALTLLHAVTVVGSRLGATWCALSLGMLLTCHTEDTVTGPQLLWFYGATAPQPIVCFVGVHLTVVELVGAAAVLALFVLPTLEWQYVVLTVAVRARERDDDEVERSGGTAAAASDADADHPKPNITPWLFRRSID